MRVIYVLAIASMMWPTFSAAQDNEIADLSGSNIEDLDMEALLDAPVVEAASRRSQS